MGRKKMGERDHSCLFSFPSSQGLAILLLISNELKSDWGQVNGGSVSLLSRQEWSSYKYGMIVTTQILFRSEKLIVHMY